MSTNNPDSADRFWDSVDRALADVHAAQSNLRDAQRLGEKYDIDGRRVVSECVPRLDEVGEELKRLSDGRRNVGSSCFPASALVATPHGDRRIAAFAVGDAVLSWSPTAKRLVERVVTRVLAHAPCDLSGVRTDDGREVATTPNHRFLTSRGWIRADRLHRGDRLVRTSEGEVAVMGVEPSGRREPVYNLITTGEHSYIVDGYVAHNFTHFLALRTWWHRLILDRSLTASVAARGSEARRSANAR